MNQDNPQATARSPRVTSGVLLYSAFGMAVVLLVSLILLTFFGPDANRLDEMALQLGRENDSGIKQELLWKAALVWRETLLGSDRPEVAHALEDLAAYYERTNRLNEAEPLLIRAVNTLESCYSENRIMRDRRIMANLDLLDSMNLLTELYLRQGNYHKAAAMLNRESSLMLRSKRTPLEDLLRYKQQVLLVAQHVPPQELPPRRVHFKSQVWNVKAAKASFAATKLRDESPQHAHEAAVINLQVIYELFAWFNLGMKHYKDAEDFLNTAILVARERDPQGKSWDAYLLELAALQERQGNLSQAEHSIQSILSIEDKTGTDNPLNLILALRDYADLQKKLGKQDEAKALDARANQLLSAAIQ